MKCIHDGSWRADLPAIAAIAATYVYFLLFDQFALLDLLQRRLPASGVQGAMAAMGLAGLLASFAAALLLRSGGLERIRRLLLAGYLLGALTAVAAPGLAGSSPIVLAAAAGVATALVTVPLAAGLRGLLATAAGANGSYGLRIGLGTGAAYLFCNLPPIFAADAAQRAVISALVAAGGFLAARRLGDRKAPAGAAGRALAAADARGLAFAGLLISFLALVWLDSAAFAVIQQEAALKAGTWGSDGQTLLLGGLHLAAALAAGWAIDRGRFRSLLFAAFLLFAAALGLLGTTGGWAAAAGPLYAAAVSLYSVALVALPAYGPEAPGLLPRRLRAAFVFGIAGWLGSALGVGMAQDLHRVPPVFLALAGGFLALAAFLSRSGVAPAGSPIAAPLVSVHGITLLGLAAGVAAFGLASSSGAAAPLDDPAPAAARGRRVYIAEGCIYCHSQYVRPGTRDEVLWGPHRDLDRSRERPPLIGLRRQGPDLSNVGRRRDAAALERQLREPRSVAEFSAMPAYRHLFAPGDRRGADLVAYLESLR